MTDQEPQELVPEDGYDTILKLSEPVRFGSDERKFINIKKPKVKQMRSLPMDLSAGSFDCLLSIAYDCSDFDSIKMFDEIPGEDVMPIIEVMMGFLGLGQGEEKTVNL